MDRTPHSRQHPCRCRQRHGGEGETIEPAANRPASTRRPGRDTCAQCGGYFVNSALPDHESGPAEDECESSPPTPCSVCGHRRGERGTGAGTQSNAAQPHEDFDYSRFVSDPTYNYMELSPQPFFERSNALADMLADRPMQIRPSYDNTTVDPRQVWDPTLPLYATGYDVFDEEPVPQPLQLPRLPQQNGLSSTEIDSWMESTHVSSSSPSEGEPDMESVASNSENVTSGSENVASDGESVASGNDNVVSDGENVAPVEEEGEEHQVASGSEYSESTSDSYSDDSMYDSILVRDRQVQLQAPQWEVPAPDVAVRNAGPTVGPARAISSHQVDDVEGGTWADVEEGEANTDLTMSGALQ
ncbi:hypothetical protein F4818DRAFT_437335 [Hypoxylon cercidicola]|nr:hypothetical protein F4818DRAFT_437335 [Hypoxylon cercidicola]